MTDRQMYRDFKKFAAKYRAIEDNKNKALKCLKLQQFGIENIKKDYDFIKICCKKLNN